MSAQERLAHWHPIRLIRFIADQAEAFGFHAGVGGRETAGAVVSYLALHPEHIEPFLTGGISELPDEWIDGGCLTWHVTNGIVVHPDTVRAAREARRLAESGNTSA